MDVENYPNEFCGGSVFTQPGSEADLEELDRKFDALFEYLDVDFIFARRSDGSSLGDKEEFSCKKER